MPSPVIRLPNPHPAQRTVMADRRRFNVICAGRRWGKTTLGIDRLVRNALHGEPVAWFSPSYRMLTEVWREARRLLEPVTTRQDLQQHRLELLGGGVLEMWSLDQPDAARGRKYRTIVVDEAAMVRDLEDAWNAVLRPTLVDLRGGAWFLSTPKGLTYFKRLYDYGQDPAFADWASWSMGTLSNPYIPSDEVEASRLMLPERTYAQEFLAMFLEDGGGVFRRVREAVGATLQDGKQAGHRYVVGVDWGKMEDFTVLCVVDATTREVVTVDRFNQIDYAVQVPRLVALCERFAPDVVYAEQNSIGVPLIEQLQRSGLPVMPFQTTNASKALIVDALALAFERGEVRIPDDPVLVGELLAYDAERLPGGLLRYGAPSGMHDDCVMSLALAWQGTQTSQVAWY